MTHLPWRMRLGHATGQTRFAAPPPKLKAEPDEIRVDAEPIEPRCGPSKTMKPTSSNSCIGPAPRFRNARRSALALLAFASFAVPGCGARVEDLLTTQGVKPGPSASASGSGAETATDETAVPGVWGSASTDSTASTDSAEPSATPPSPAGSWTAYPSATTPSPYPSASTNVPVPSSTAPSTQAPVCSFGYDQTCNDELGISSFHGSCDASGQCTCLAQFSINPATGRCR